MEPRILTDFEAHLAMDNNLLNLELGSCECEALCTCEEDE